MTNVDFALMADEIDDDLPRTVRREKEARERAAMERRMGSSPPPLSVGGFGDRVEEPVAYPMQKDIAPPASVVSFNVPFLRLMAFFLKAVLAAIPALILLGVILWFGGHLLQSYFPELVKMQILIRFPN